MRCLVLALISACQAFPGSGGGTGSGGEGADGPAAIDAGTSGGAGVFDPSISQVVVEIDYEAGEAPYTGPILGFGDTFEPTLANVDRLFAGTKQLVIPTTIAEMEDVGVIADEELTVQDIIALGALHRGQHDRSGVKTYYIVFVSGYFTDGTGPHDTVLGVSIGDTIAMFKDVIRGTAVIGQPNVVRYVEQSTLIHELAHSVGLVDNGLPMATAHKDEAHGAHCSNPDCVMYWLNEGSGDAADFAIRRLLTGSTILFDAACLADADAQTGGP